MEETHRERLRRETLEAMKRQPYEKEEDCCGHYTHDKAEARRCHGHTGVGCSTSDYPVNDAGMTGRQCFQAYLDEEKRRHQARLDAMTPEERENHDRFIKELREQL